MGESLTERNGQDRTGAGTTGSRSTDATAQVTRRVQWEEHDPSWNARHPVTATMLARDTAAVLDRVEHDRQDIPVVRHGVMVAVIRPTTPLLAASVAASAMGREVSSRELQRGAAGGMLRDVAAGVSIVLTRQNKPVAEVVDVTCVADEVDSRLAPVLKEAADVFARIDAEDP